MSFSFNYILIFAVIFAFSFLFYFYKKKHDEIMASTNAFLHELSDLKSQYISKSMCDQFLEKFRFCYINAIKIRNFKYCPHDILFNVTSVVSNYEELPHKRNAWNDLFIENELAACSDMLSNISGRTLDIQQRKAVIINEDSNLVIAGAGSGKTLTITAKVKYLCERKNINPEEILLVAYNRSAANEISLRLKNMGIPIEAKTFHKIGLDIITSSKKYRPNILDSGKKRQFFDWFFSKGILENSETVKAMIQFLAYFIHIPTDVNEITKQGELFEKEWCFDLETLKSKCLTNDPNDLKLKKSLKGEYLKSLEEVIIANYFFLHGINYEYEKQYPFKIEDNFRKNYTPDFYLPDYDIYLEHFGINKEGRAPWLSPIEEEKYIDGIKWKRELHNRQGTKLIETYSWYDSEGILLEKLENTLVALGVTLKEPDYIAILNKVKNKVEHKQLEQFSTLCQSFIALFKANGYTENDLDELSYKSDIYTKKDFYVRRLITFKVIIKQLLVAYSRFLNEQAAIDYSDMIIQATRCLKYGCLIPSIKYIIVDEYQDISIDRCNLIKAIIDRTGAHLMCVGDDWQSIYRFSGSDISLFSSFEEVFGTSETIRIEKTYRNSQELLNIASAFITKNKAQVHKELISDKHCDKPVKFYLYNSSPEAALIKSLDYIINKYGEEQHILLLGKTHYDEEIIKGSEYFRSKGRFYIYQKYPNVCIEFLTVHKSKGTEADNVILLQFNNERCGFPTQINDDPVLQLVMSKPEEFKYAEERRVLYVALTRTRNEIAILVNNYHPSEFFREFEARNDIAKIAVDPIDSDPLLCPVCGTGQLCIRERKDGTQFVGCSNYPRCTFIENNTTILKVRKRCTCGGYFVMRNGYYGPFLGCTNYFYKKRPCKKTLQLSETDISL